jgi:phosphotransacetylase
MCRGIQRQLRSLYPKASIISKLERLCNLAARSYIDIILVHSPGRINDVTQQLNQALTEVHISEEKEKEKGKDDIINLVFGMLQRNSPLAARIAIIRRS